MMDTNDIIKRSGLSNYYSGCKNFPSYRFSYKKGFDNITFNVAYLYAVNMACRENAEISYEDLVCLYKLCFPLTEFEFRDFDLKFMYTADYLPNFHTINGNRLREELQKIDYSVHDKILLAADVHKRIVSLHPFKNGNGRIARLCMNAILLRAGYYPLFVTQDWRHEYCSAQDIDRKFGGNTFDILIKQKIRENEREHLHGVL